MSKPQRPEPGKSPAPLTRTQRHRLAQFHVDNLCPPHTEAEAWESAAALPDADLVEAVQLRDPQALASILGHEVTTTTPAPKARGHNVELEALRYEVGALIDNAFRRGYRAASAELLEACELAEENLAPAYSPDHLVMRKLRAAIAKAKEAA